MTLRPNILWIVATQWRAQALGSAGDANARTPCLDTLAAQGVNFTQAVTPHPFGPFARAAMLTGVASPENGVRDYFDTLPAGAPTIAQAMRNRGYATAYFGAWHLGERARNVPLLGEAQARIVVPPEGRGGFEFWEGFGGGFLLNDPWLHGSRLAEPREFKGYQSDVLIERAAAWLGQSGGGERGPRRPWFAVVGLDAPHPPYDAPAAGCLAHPPEDIVLRPNVPRGGETEAKARKELAGYYAHIEATDGAIGRLVAAVDDVAQRNGETPPLLVFTSVHGDMHGSNGHFRKGWPHEESVRVPLVVRMPAGLRSGEGRAGAAGSSNADAISLLDLPAMTRAWAEGKLAALERNQRLISMPSIVALPHQCDRVWHGVRTPSRKLVLNDDGTPWLYFDLARDPWEEHNLVDDVSRRDEMRALGEQAGIFHRELRR